MSSGSHTYKVKENVAALQWEDKKLVNVLTTTPDPRKTVTVQKRQNDGYMVYTPCPLAIVEYTKHMRDVDRFHQLREYYTVSTRPKKWWMKVFYFLLGCCLVNSYIL